MVVHPLRQAPQSSDTHRTVGTPVKLSRLHAQEPVQVFKTADKSGAHSSCVIEVRSPFDTINLEFFRAARSTQPVLERGSQRRTIETVKIGDVTPTSRLDSSVNPPWRVAVALRGHQAD
jgi:hypothetical protein